VHNLVQDSGISERGLMTSSMVLELGYDKLLG
jgi:hypothetical protein